MPSPRESPTTRVLQCDPVANRKMIAQLKDDAADLLPFVTECFRVLVRINPVNIQIHEFLEHINQIQENTSPKKTARLVREAIESVDLSDAVAMLDSHQVEVANLGPNLIASYSKKLRTGWPETLQIVRHPWLDDATAEGERVRQLLLSAMCAYRQDLAMIQNRFRQLRKFHQRYDDILTRDRSTDYALGFAAGFFGGELGELAAQVWDGWQDKSDAKFMRSFGKAVDRFSTSALEFSIKTEEAVEPVVTLFVKSLSDLHQWGIAALETVVDTRDITTVYRSLHYSTQEEAVTDPASQEFLELVLTNLREGRISARAEANIREMERIG